MPYRWKEIIIKVILERWSKLNHEEYWKFLKDKIHENQGGLVKVMVPVFTECLPCPLPYSEDISLWTWEMVVQGMCVCVCVYVFQYVKVAICLLIL